MKRGIDKDEIEIYKLTMLLNEAKKRYESVDTSFKENRNRMFVLFSGELAVMTFLFSDLLNIMPDELYGRVIFIMACSGIVFSVGLLFIFNRSIFNWPSPIGPLDREKIKQMNNKKEILEYMINDYVNARNDGHKILTRKAKALNLSIQIFILSAIILMIIKIF